MKNEKGQALVEFVLILPVFLLLIFAFIDVGRIILCKNHLENVMSDVVSLINNEETIDEIKSFLKEENEYDIKITINENTNRIVTLKTTLDLVTPGFQRIFDDPYQVKVERRIIDE